MPNPPEPSRTAPLPRTATPAQRGLLGWLVAATVLFLFLGFHDVGERGIVAEEIQPYLARHPHVLETRRRDDRTPGPDIVPMPPYEIGAPSRPRWVSTSQWPVIAYDGTARQWPLFLRGHQTALGSYLAMALEGPLGGGIVGLRRATVLLGLVVVLGAVTLAWRIGDPSTRHVRAGVTLLAMALCAGGLFVARFAEAFEVASRTFFMVALVLAARDGPPSRVRMAFIGLAGACAVLSRATIVLTLVPVLVWWFLPRERRPTRNVAFLGAALALGLPLLGVAIVGALVHFREGSDPLSAFPAFHPWKQLASAGRQLLLSAAFIGDAMGIFRPLHLGEMHLERSLPLPAVLGGVPFVVACVRWARGRAGIGEQWFVLTMVLSSIASTLMYRNGNQPQLALPIEPLFALAVAEQVAALPRLSLQIGGAVLVAVIRAQSVISELYYDGHTHNPMFSRSTQLATLGRLQTLGVRSTEVMTTVYNQAGVLEEWSHGTLTPWHAWPALQIGDRTRTGDLDRAWSALLDAYRPRYIVVTEGTNLFETQGLFPDLILASLHRTAAARGFTVAFDRHFPTEVGTPGWGILRVDYPRDTPPPVLTQP